MQPLERDVEILRNIPLFAGVSSAKLKLIAYTAEVVRFELGEILVRQGDPADSVYIITEGEAEVRLLADDGHEIHLGTLGRHSLLGEIGVLSSGRRTATVWAGREVVSLKIGAQLFLDLLRQCPEISMQVMKILAQRLEKAAAFVRQHQRREVAP